MYINRAYSVIVAILGLISLSACGIFSQRTSTPTQLSEQMVHTAVAMTLEAILTPPASKETISAPPPTTQPPPVSTDSLTSTDSPPMDTVTPTNTPLPTRDPCDQAAFVTDVTIPDGTLFTPGVTFVKTWRLQNTGICTWDSGYDAFFFSGDLMGAPESVQLTTSTVAPGDSVDVSVTLVSPTEPGTYRGDWKLSNILAGVFGIGGTDGPFYVEIVVEEATPGPSQTPTPGIPNFNFEFRNTHACADGIHATFSFDNTGEALLQSTRVHIVDQDTSMDLYGPAYENAPFLDDENDCPPGDDAIDIASESYIAVNLGSTPPSGHDAQATIKACTRDDMEGDCVEMTVSFVIP